MTYLLRLVACLFLCVSLNTKAMVIYDETLNGDSGLPDPLTGLPWSYTQLGNLGVGTFEINGFNEGLDFDLFQFDLENSSIGSIIIESWSGYRWVDIIISTNLNSPQVELVGNLYNQGLNILSEDLTSCESVYCNGGFSIHNFNINLSSNIFYFGLLPNPQQLSSGSISYTFKIETASPVPLPAGIYLFLSGLVGLGLMRGRNG